VLPASAYAEVLVGPSQRGAAAMTTVDEFLASAAIRIEPLTREIARHAATLRARHRALRLPDALVIATGETLEALVLTADRAWLGVSRRARLIAE